MPFSHVDKNETIKKHRRLKGTITSLTEEWERLSIEAGRIKGTRLKSPMVREALRGS